jgi:hypothetical protein
MCVSLSLLEINTNSSPKSLLFSSFVCVCRFFLAAGTYVYVYVHEDVRKKNLEPVALAGVVVVVQQHHKNSTTTTPPRGCDSGRSHWLTVKLETSRGNRSIKLSDFFSFISQTFPICTTTSSSSPFRRREISFKKSRTIYHHRLGVEPTTLRLDPFILIFAGDKNKREEAALHAIDDDKFLT